MFPGETLSFSFTSVLTDPLPLHPRPAGTVSPGSAGDRNGPLRTSRVLRVQADSSHPPTQQSGTLNSAPFTGGVAEAGRGPAGSSRALSLEAGSGQDRAWDVRAPPSGLATSVGCWANPASALGSEVGVREGRPPPGVAGVPRGGGDAAHRKSGCRPPLPIRPAGCPPSPWPPLPHTQTRLLATHPLVHP